MEPERCAECGFDATRLTVQDAIVGLRSLGRRWHEAFDGVPDETLRARPDATTWSPLEYAVHTRDVLGLLTAGLGPVLAGDEPSFPDVQPEEGAPDHGWNRLDPETVVRELGAAADAEADLAAKARPEQFARTGTLGPQTFDGDWLVKHSVHDATHHLFDVGRILGRR